MSAKTGTGVQSSYISRLLTLVVLSVTQLVRPPSHSWRAEAARRAARHVLLATAVMCGAVIAMMYILDVREIGLMPPRGTANLWPIRILTDLGNSGYVLWLVSVQFCV